MRYGGNPVKEQEVNRHDLMNKHQKDICFRTTLDPSLFTVFNNVM